MRGNGSCPSYLEERMLGVCLTDDLAIMLILVRDVR
jgi:hypothetical protein